MIPLLSATQLAGTPSAMAAATLSSGADPDHFWVGDETIRTYIGGGAEQALSDLRAFVGRCPAVGEFKFSVVPGPQLGDSSLHLRCAMTSGTDTLECDAILIRIGTTLVAVNEEGNDPGGDKTLARLAEAALHRYMETQ